ncbi:L-proline trans-4-hydroxylase-like isoform X2 [Ciona intestinalis]
MKTAFDKDGFVLVRGLFTVPEIDKLEKCLELGHVTEHAFDLPDGEEMNSRMVIFNHPGVDYTGLIGRCRRIVDTTEELLGGEVYHYHTKINMKQPETGGSFQWHQDYGYWYKNGILFPDLLSVMVAIHKCDRGNGCLKVLRGSHKLGRIDHIRIGGQNGADLDTLAECQKILEQVYVELEPGDGIFFHCNVLHSSDQNHSDRKRWVIIPCYNRMDNNPYIDHHHARATKLVKVDDSDLLACDVFDDVTGKWFMDPSIDKTIIAEKVNKDVTSLVENPPEYKT